MLRFQEQGIPLDCVPLLGAAGSQCCVGLGVRVPLSSSLPVIPSGSPGFLTALQLALMFSGLGAVLVWWECQEWDVHKQDLTCWRESAWEKAQCRL